MRPAPAPAPSPFHVTLDPTAVSGLPRVTLSATDEGGHTDTYGGVSLRDLLTKLGAPAGAPVRGKAMTSYVLIGAADGYHVLFTLPELDPSYTDHVVLIADTKDGAPIAADGGGPYRLVVPFEKRQARWVKSVTSVSLENAPLP
jgi:DMSO/TMAO reductase YedYZ molybdopterin-dependent catalytic subunit